MKKKIKTGFIMTSFIIFSLILWYVMNQISLLNNINLQKVREPNYHFSLIINDNDSLFWEKVKEGAEVAAREYNIVLEKTFVSDYKEVSKNIDMATLSRVDGIMANATSSEDFKFEIDKAVAYQVPVITLATDSDFSYRNAFIGTNNFLLGKEAGKLLLKSTPDPLKIGLVMHETKSSNNYAKNVILTGLREVLKEREGSEILEVTSSKVKYLGAEEVASELIDKYPDLNCIFASNSGDTLGVVQAVIDRNKVGEISIVGFDYNKDVLDYIRKGVIYGSVARNPYEIGYRAVEELYNYKKDRKIEQQIYIDPTIMDSDSGL